MAALLGSLASAKTLILGEGGPSIDNWTFRLYYRYSTTFLMGASLLVTANQFFGEPILCDMVGKVCVLCATGEDTQL